MNLSKKIVSQESESRKMKGLKIKKVMIVLGMGLIFCGVLAGCRKDEKDYIGKYVKKSATPDGIQGTTMLEIRPDHTWGARTEYEKPLSPVFTYSGRWEIIKGKIVLHGRDGMAPETIEAELKGNELIDQHGLNNEVYVKQD